MFKSETYYPYNRKLLTLLAVTFGFGISVLPFLGIPVFSENLENLPFSLGKVITYSITCTALFSFIVMQSNQWLKLIGLIGLVLVKGCLLYLLVYKLHMPLGELPLNLSELSPKSESLLVYYQGFSFLLGINLVLFYLILEGLYSNQWSILEIVPFVGFVYCLIQVSSILLIGFLEGSQLLIDANSLISVLGLGLLVGSIVLFKEDGSLLFFLPSKSESGFMFRFALVFTVFIPVLFANLFFKTYHGISNPSEVLWSQILIVGYILIVVSGFFRFSNKVKNYQIEQSDSDRLLIEKNLEITKINQELDHANKVLAYYNEEIQKNFYQLKRSSEIQRDQQSHIENLLSASLEESENKYKRIFDSHPLPVIIFSISDTNVLNANLAAQKLYGYNLDQFRTLLYQDLLDKGVEQLAGFSTPFNDLRSASTTITLKQNSASGALLVVESVGYSIDYEGELAYMAVFIDVTDKYITDYRFKSLSDSLQVVFFELDREYNYVYMNKFCEELIQTSAAELVGTNLLDFLPSYKGSKFLEMVDLTIATNEPQLFIMDVKGHHILTDTFYDVYFYPTLAGVAVLSREITKEKQIQLAFEKQQELINAIVTTIPSLVYIRNLETEIFEFSNEGMGNVLGEGEYEKPKSLNDIRKLVHPSDLYLFEQVLAKPAEILKNQNTINVEYRLRNNTGSYVFVNHRFVPFETDASGKLIKVLSVLNSVQDYKQIQAELTFAKSKAEDASIAKSNFLANMSHELRNPLYALSGITQILERDFTNEPRLGLYVDLMKQSTERLLDTIGDVLDLSKIEQNKIQVQSAVFDLTELIQNAIKFYSPMALKKGLTLDFASAFTEVLVNLDTVLVDRVLGNLISNAVKFTFTGGITICLDKFIEGNSQKVIITVSDTGIGMSNEFLENYIFKSFEQESGGITKVYEGTGLGLHIIKKYIELQEGSIWVESQKNKGSTFFVMFKQPLEIKQTTNENETKDIIN